MVSINDLIPLSKNVWEIPRKFRQDMQVPVRVFSTREMLEQVMDDRSLEQAVNVATLPGLVSHVAVMPDMHQGYGFPIGGVAAMRMTDGVISPGGIGYDINCGVRLLASNIELGAARHLIDSLATRLNQVCPSGVGSKGSVLLTNKELDSVLNEGSHWTFKNGYANKSDLEKTEENGRMDLAIPGNVSRRAKQRGISQLGSVGAGNHFIELDVIDEIFDEKAAQVMGLRPGCLVVQIHCGSRGLGHQVCSDYVMDFQSAMSKYGIQLPDRELACAPLDSQEGKAYLGAMAAAANFAFANRQVLAHACRQAFDEVFVGDFKDRHLRQVYDLAHNMGKIETHLVGGRAQKTCVHRKGATRAFGPGNPDIPQDYQQIGQPVLVPGSMGTCSWVLTGTTASMDISFGSCCHGAGRLMSRSRAKKLVQGGQLIKELNAKGIKIQAGSLSGLAEEAPLAYKDVDTVVETVVNLNIARKVARLLPVAVIKG